MLYTLILFFHIGQSGSSMAVTSVVGLPDATACIAAGDAATERFSDSIKRVRYLCVGVVNPRTGRGEK